MAKPIPRLSPTDVAQIVALAWEAPDPLTAVLYSHGLSEGQLVQLLRRELTPSAYKLWAQRVKAGGGQKAPKRDGVRAAAPSPAAKAKPKPKPKPAKGRPSR